MMVCVWESWRVKVWVRAGVLEVLRPPPCEYPVQARNCKQMRACMWYLASWKFLPFLTRRTRERWVNWLVGWRGQIIMAFILNINLNQQQNRAFVEHWYLFYISYTRQLSEYWYFMIISITSITVICMWIPRLGDWKWRIIMSVIYMLPVTFS